MGLLDKLRGVRTTTPHAILTPGLTVARSVSAVVDPDGAPALDLSKQDDVPLDLTKQAERATLNLEKSGLSGIRATVVLILDHSGSMRGDYEDGYVQRLVQRFLAAALPIDPAGYVTIIPFDSRAYPALKVGYKAHGDVESYVDIVDRRIWRPGSMGSTNLAAALGVVVRDILPTAKLPVYLAVASDGEPDSEPLTTDMYCELSRWADFIKNLSLKPVKYFQMLDTSTSLPRLIDNCNSQPEKGSSLNLLTCSDDEFFAALTAEWSDWFTKATDAGILT